MLRRFMNWLLHQLQKLLNTLSGRRVPSRPPSSTQDDLEEGTAQKSGSALLDASTPAEISFSIKSSDASAQPVDSQQKDSIQRAVEAADDRSDTHMRLDPTPSAIPGNPSDVLNLESAPSDPQAATPTVDISPADQLPSIHDLLPAVEQEIKENSVQFDDVSIDEGVQSDEEATFTNSDSSETDEPLSASEIPEPENIQSKNLEPKTFEPEQPELEDDIEPEQALLFSFDITEQSSDEQISSSIEDLIETTAVPASRDEVSSSVEDSIAETVENAVEQDVETPDLDNSAIATEDTAFTSEDSETAAIDRASLPYPWSIAYPKCDLDEKEDSSAPPLEAPEQTDAQAEQKTSTERKAVSVSPNSSTSTQSVQNSDFSTKHGVVKLLFTMKEGNFHGYIEPKDGSSDILFHQKYINEDIFDSLERGVEVVVSVKQMEGKAYATQVELAQ